MTHIWNIVTNKASLWVRWIHTYKLKGRTIWDVPVKADMSWGWRKLLQIRECVKPFFWTKLGNGKNASFWYDRWCSQSPIIEYLSPRDITNEGYNLQNRVADMITQGGWSWPQSWLLKAPILGLIQVPTLENSRPDTPQWKDRDGKYSIFSVQRALDALRPRGNEVTWHQIVWFSHCIPRHAFHLWLVMRNSLKTQDLLKKWDVGINSDLTLLCCPLCAAQPDSHGHLFFECPFAANVWLFIRHLAGMEHISVT